MKDKCVFDVNKLCGAGRYTTCDVCINGPIGTQFIVNNTLTQSKKEEK